MTRQDRKEENPETCSLSVGPLGWQVYSIINGHQPLGVDPGVDYNQIHSLLTRFFIVTIRGRGTSGSTTDVKVSGSWLLVWKVKGSDWSFLLGIWHWKHCNWALARAALYRTFSSLIIKSAKFLVGQSVRLLLEHFLEIWISTSVSTRTWPCGLLGNDKCSVS